jgi:hypothetical protein
MGRNTRMKEIGITGVLATRLKSDGRRRMMLNQKERKDLIKHQKMEAAVALFLDLENDHSWAEIAAELKMSVRGLRDLTKSEEFMATYDTYFAELGHDPRLRAMEQATADMLPLAIRQLRGLLLNSVDTVKMSAIKEVIRLNHLAEDNKPASNRTELNEFLKGIKDGTATMELNQVKVSIPKEFSDKLAEYLPASEVIDAVLRDPEDEDELASSAQSPEETEVFAEDALSHIAAEGFADTRQGEY